MSHDSQPPEPHVAIRDLARASAEAAGLAATLLTEAEAAARATHALSRAWDSAAPVDPTAVIAGLARVELLAGLLDRALRVQREALGELPIALLDPSRDGASAPRRRFAA